MFLSLSPLLADGGGQTITWTMLVNMLVGVILPIIVALVTRTDMAPRLRAITLLSLSTVSGVLTEWLVSSGDFDWLTAVYNAVIIFVIGVATLYGLWKPTGVSDAAKNAGV